jgi:hypothetical protein
LLVVCIIRSGDFTSASTAVKRSEEKFFAPMAWRKNQGADSSKETANHPSVGGGNFFLGRFLQRGKNVL